LLSEVSPPSPLRGFGETAFARWLTKKLAGSPSQGSLARLAEARWFAYRSSLARLAEARWLA